MFAGRRSWSPTPAAPPASPSPRSAPLAGRTRSTPSHRERERRVRELVELVDVASALGATVSCRCRCGRRRVGRCAAARPRDRDLPADRRRAGIGGRGDLPRAAQPQRGELLNRVGQAAVLARMIDRPRVQALADLFHMKIEETSFDAPIAEAGARLGACPPGRQHPPGAGHRHARSATRLPGAAPDRLRRLAQSRMSPLRPPRRCSRVGSITSGRCGRAGA